MGVACSRRRVVVRTQAAAQAIAERWSRLVVTYLERIRHVAYNQRAFTASSLFLRRTSRSLLDSATRGRRLEIV
jgi:hypothetical protein